MLFIIISTLELNNTFIKKNNKKKQRDHFCFQSHCRIFFCKKKKKKLS